MADYKLIYFNLRARAETTRLLFKLAGKEFEDKRIEMADWPAFKPSTPLGQVPVLEVGDKTLVQSGAIARYIAREFGLAGETSWDQAISDMIVESAADVGMACRELRMKATTEEEKAAAAEKVELVAGGFSKLLATHRKGKFLLGDKATLGDVVTFSLSELLTVALPGCLEKNEALNQIAKSFSEIPAISEWVASRPVTAF